MNRLLRNLDYKSLIQDDDLGQIINSDNAILLQAEQAAQQEIQGYLAQRYRTDRIFSNTSEFDISTTYNANSLVEYTAPTYSSATTYSTNNHIVFSGYVYTALSGSSNVIPSASSASTTWSAITADRTLYYAKVPYAEYSLETTYYASDIVYYDNNVYSSVGSSLGKVPSSTSIYWSTISGYSFSGQYCENTSYWTEGDNRNAYLIQSLLDVCIYNLFCRINPRLITELREMRMLGVRKWLKDVSNGVVIADLPKILPTQGLKVSWGYNNQRDRLSY